MVISSKRCNVMPEAYQLRLIESIEWRMWYIAQPAFQSNFNALVKHVHAMPPADKERLHDGYHNAGTQPQCGEKITGRLCVILAPEFCQELGVRNLNTAANVLEQTQQHAYMVNHACYQQVRDIIDMTLTLSPARWSTQAVMFVGFSNPYSLVQYIYHNSNFCKIGVGLCLPTLTWKSLTWKSHITGNFGQIVFFASKSPELWWSNHGSGT